MQIYIHTLGRVDSQPTLIYLRAAGVNPTLVVQPQEAQSYRQVYKTTPLLILPKEIKGLSPTRQWLLENCPERYMVLCDDDLRFARKNPEDRTRLLEPKPQDMADMIAAVKSKLQVFAHVGISARGDNNRKEGFFYKNERMMRFLAYDRERVPPSCRFDRIPAKQDFDMTLQLLRKGLANCVIYEWAQDQVKASNARGGCATYRTEEMAEAAAKELQRLHPHFVSLVEKSNSNWKGFTKPTRLEAHIAWKQAFEAGLKKRRMLR
jgi:hypothetical protein